MVCVPFSVDKIDSFNPFEVPTVDKLCSELETINMINLDKKIKGLMCFRIVLVLKIRVNRFCAIFEKL